MTHDRTVGHEFLVFALGAEEYGVDILKVQEIRGYDTVTQMPNMPDYLLGVVNLRGVIVPIIDLRIRFQLERVEYNHQTVVVILNIGGRVVGAVVDSVSDVMTLGAEQISAPPKFGSKNTDYLTGLGSVDERMLILVDIEKMLSPADMALVERASAYP
jgi:purine-binding chemotaxis protein CheW